jgi:hypothetical protein
VEGDAEIVQSLLDQGAGEDAVHEEGNAPEAANVDNTDAERIQLSLEQDASVDTLDDEGSVPKAWSAKGTETVQPLFEQDASLDTVDEGGSPLEATHADDGDAETVQRPLDQIATVGAVGEVGSTPEAGSVEGDRLHPGATVDVVGEEWSVFQETVQVSRDQIQILVADPLHSAPDETGIDARPLYEAMQVDADPATPFPSIPDHTAARSLKETVHASEAQTDAIVTDLATSLYFTPEGIGAEAARHRPRLTEIGRPLTEPQESSPTARNSVIELVTRVERLITIASDTMKEHGRVAQALQLFVPSPQL